MTTEVGLIGAGHMARGTLWTLKAALPKLKRVYPHLAPAGDAGKTRPRTVGREMGIEIDARGLVAGGVRQGRRGGRCRPRPSSRSIKESWLRPGCTVYSMGAQQELDTPSYLEVDKFIADDWGQVQLKADMVDLMGKGLFTEANLYGDMPRILAGKLPGRENAKERIVIRSEGIVTMDVALAHHLYHLALERGVGQFLDA